MKARSAILLVQLPLDVIPMEASHASDSVGGHIQAHLQRYFSKCEVLPAITIAIDDRGLTVVQGWQYVLAAKAIGRETIRALITSSPASEDVKQLLSRDDVIVLDFHAIMDRDSAERTVVGWHVYFFERALSAAEEQSFNRVVWDVFGHRDIEIHHDGSGPVAEFEAETPVGDHAWATRNMQDFGGFAREHVPIVSFQGRHLRGWPGQSGQ